MADNKRDGKQSTEGDADWDNLATTPGTPASAAEGGPPAPGREGAHGAVKPPLAAPATVKLTDGKHALPPLTTLRLDPRRSGPEAEPGFGPNISQPPRNPRAGNSRPGAFNPGSSLPPASVAPASPARSMPLMITAGIGIVLAIALVWSLATRPPSSEPGPSDAAAAPASAPLASAPNPAPAGSAPTVSAPTVSAPAASAPAASAPTGATAPAPVSSGPAASAAQEGSAANGASSPGADGSAQARRDASQAKSSTAPSRRNTDPVAGASAASSQAPQDANHPVGYLNVTSNPITQVVVDGVKLNERTPLKHFPLPVGQHELIFKTSDGRFSGSYVVIIEKGETATVPLVTFR